MNKSFSFNEPAFEITKSYRDTSGQMFVEGLASTINIDETGERMSPEVIAKMAARLVGKPLRDEHEKGWYDKLGEIVKADVIKDKDGKPALWIKAKLHDWNSKARDLFNLLKDGAEKMGLSVAGHINPGGIVKQFIESVGKYVPTYIDVEPTEVSVTDHPANLDTFAYAVAKSMKFDESSNIEDIKKVIPVITDTNREGVNTMDKQKLTSKTVSPDVVTLVKDWNPTMAADMGGELKKVEKATEDKVVQKTEVVKTEEKPVEKKEEVKTEAKKAEVETETKTEAKKADVETKTETETEKAKADTSSLDGILKDLAETLSSLKTGLSSADEEKKKTEKKEEKKETEKAVTKESDKKTDEDEVDKVFKAMEEALKNLKMCLGKTKKADDSQSSSTVTETKTAEKKVEKKEEKTTTPGQGSDYTTEKKLEAFNGALAKIEKALTDLNEKVEKIPNLRKGTAMVVEKNLGATEGAEVKKTTEDFKDPFVEGRKTEMYKKMMNDPEITFQDMQKYLNAGIIPEKYNKLDAKDELKKNLMKDPNVSFQQAHRALNSDASKK